MKRLLQVLAIGLFCGLLIALVFGRILSKGAPGNRAETVSDAPGPIPVAEASTAPAGFPRGKPDEQALARVKELEKMALEKRQRDHAAEKMHEARQKLQFNKHRDWMEVVEAHRHEFEALRQEAAQSPNKKVPCTICDATGVLDLCVVCDHTGKCPTCRGTGKYFDEVCAACSGSGKCFLCFGSGKMPCPFSQSLPLLKEVITPDTPDPSPDLPID